MGSLLIAHKFPSTINIHQPLGLDSYCSASPGSHLLGYDTLLCSILLAEEKLRVLLSEEKLRNITLSNLGTYERVSAQSIKCKGTTSPDSFGHIMCIDHVHSFHNTMHEIEPYCYCIACTV